MLAIVLGDECWAQPMNQVGAGCSHATTKPCADWLRERSGRSLYYQNRDPICEVPMYRDSVSRYAERPWRF